MTLAQQIESDHINAAIDAFIASGKRTARLHDCVFMSRLQNGCSFYIETVRHPGCNGVKKHITYKTWQEAMHAWQNLLPARPRIDNLAVVKESLTTEEDADYDTEEDNAPITREQFIQQVCDWRVLVADAHAAACVAQNHEDAAYWRGIDSFVSNLMTKASEQ